MKQEILLEIYQIIAEGSLSRIERKGASSLRKFAMNEISSGKGFTKVAFDSRRIDQETEYNPRRGLQNYNRSEQFVSEAMAQKIKNFAKLRNVLVGLKDKYGKEPEWQDSNARVLLSTLDKGLRVNEKDGDFSEAQPAMGSLDYIEELLHVRYRLGFDDMTKLGELDLKKALLAKDEELTRKDVNSSLEISKKDVSNQSYNDLIDKLFGGVKATEENPVVERTVTITIRDSIKDK
jgi:hypothetical protein